MSFILFVLHNPEKLMDLLAAWQDAGVDGATVLFSTGMGRIRPREGLRDDIPLMPSLEDFYPDPECLSRTIFTVIGDDSLIDKVVAATEEIVGSLNDPNTGLFVVLPTARVYGIEKRRG
ncbi:MAG: hypothetical protein QMD04_14030 [Anaerolineales bacterium]|nr:hypothetical protein [Anaerolineales bacterium]